MDPVASFMAQYGVLGVLGYLVVKDVGGYLLNRFMPSSTPATPTPATPANPAAPALPTDPATPSAHPILDAVLKKVFGKLAVPATQTDPSFLSALKADLDRAVSGIVAAK